MNIFELFLGRRLMNEEGGGSVLGGGDTPAPATQPSPSLPSDPVDPQTRSTLDEINGDPKPKADPTPEETPEAKAQREAAEKAAKDAVPETYADFKVPEGLELNGEVLTEFQGLAKELGLSQEKAQKLIDLQTKLAQGGEQERQQQLQQALDAQAKQWTDQIKADPELGGEKFEASKQVAVKAMAQFGNDALRHILNESGLGNHPELFRLFHKVGQAISEDKIVIPGSDASQLTDKRAADVMFGDVKFD